MNVVQVCSVWNQLITTSSELCYKVALGLHSKFDGSPDALPLSSAHRLQLLNAHESNWRTLNIRKRVGFTIRRGEHSRIAGEDCVENTFNYETPGFACHRLPSSIASEQDNPTGMNVEPGKDFCPKVGTDNRQFDDCFIDVDNELVICELT